MLSGSSETVGCWWAIFFENWDHVARDRARALWNIDGYGRERVSDCGRGLTIYQLSSFLFRFLQFFLHFLVLRGF